MKIMMVTPYFYPKGGGLENYAFTIVKGLQAQGHDVFVVTSNHQSKQYVDEVVEDIRVIRLPITFKFSNTPVGLGWYWQLKKIIKVEKPDVINAHAPVPGIADMSIYAAKKTPTVLTYHAATLKKEGSLAFKLVALAYDFVQRPTFRKATRIIAVSDYVKECLQPRYQQKTAVVYNAVDPDEIPRTSVARRQHRLIFVGSLDKTHAWKGLDLILDSLSKLKKADPQVELLVLGDGNMRSDYDATVQRLGIGTNVLFKGFIRGDEKYELIKSASAMLVYPTSENDAFPTVFLESWACGTPVVAARIGALTSLITNTDAGVLVEPHDSAALARTVQDLLADPAARHRLSEHGLQAVAQRFLWKTSVTATAALFAEISKKRQSR